MYFPVFVAETRREILVSFADIFSSESLRIHSELYLGENFSPKAKRGCRISKYFCWAVALLYVKMGSKSVVISIPSLINTVHSQTSLSACLISNCFVFNYQNLCRL